ncbi:MAG: guanylate kinase [Erysipelotrichaceae bacterium]|nr:guanylate kinase [Erysipelotrichaceae bacterium]MBR4485342.1 guanylate kinase [Erysipelotrichaceae bacterium]MCR5097094.1 guanylate kinase [Erysipelotrichaceae bacterium]
MKKGLLIVFSGLSGVGKGTILAELMKMEDLNLAYSVSMTTRDPRPGEVDGVNYFFVSKKRFLEAVKNGELLEHARFVDNDYGTPKAYVDEQRQLGKNVVLEIEIKGARQIMEKCPDSLSIYIVPPSIEELERRLRERQSEDDQTIMKRVSKARQELKELQESDIYEHIVCNDDLDKAIAEVREIILTEMKK